MVEAEVRFSSRRRPQVTSARAVEGHEKKKSVVF
jgi:hypothetical protein